MNLSNAIRRIDCDDAESEAVDFTAHQQESVRASSRALGWGPLNFERREAPPASNCLPAGSTEHLVFVSLAGGQIKRESDGEVVESTLSPGCVAIQPSDRPVRWEWQTRLNFSVMSLNPVFVDKVAKDVFGLEHGDFELLVTERAHDPVITNIAGVLSREVVRGEPGGKLYAESLANILAVHLLRHYSRRLNEEFGAVADAAAGASAADQIAVKSNGQSRAVADALRFIHDNYSQELSLNDIADSVHLSPFHLARVFKHALGIAPHQYLIQVRVNSARSLLSAGSGERSLAEVASAVGFADQSHLTRHFKRQYGVTPKHFRH